MRLFTADIYRLVRTRGIYIAWAAIMIIAGAITNSQSVGGVMVGTESAPKYTDAQWSLVEIATRVSLSTSVVMYILIAVFVMTVGYEFSQKTYKNTLTSGISRLQFIVNKFIALLVIVFIMIFSYFGVAIITGLFKHSVIGGTVHHFWNVLITCVFSQTLAICVIFSLAVVVLVISKSLIISSIFIVAWPMIMTIVAVFSRWDWVKYFDFFTISNRLALGELTIDKIAPYLVVSVLTILATWLLTIFAMNHQEL
ncbi:ABC transporter permease [Pediococcus argentinicus]|uniref:Uncharacterized protein n=1 Tax=Pediococcus argentinicus TaxID=480391 RepID=A0A0R2NJE7_9LACO|nr:ABC transporter permease [Pediococcus argentinicus]KRO25879.1 hypothetical protein IV88_GL001414 [Pediococcus argentinicus]NKZ21872.1 ABC transporter permease subunit [Pediococcus argentinicus]GEP19042.1 ABC transporter [Pediococcus argentinicus]